MDLTLTILLSAGTTLTTVFLGPIAVEIVKGKIEAYRAKKVLAEQERKERTQARKAETIQVARINPRDISTIEKVIKLYTHHFPNDGTNYSPDELLVFLEQPVFEGRFLVDVENISLVAKNGSSVVGLMLCHFYPARRKAIVSYYAIDKRDSEARANKAAMKMAQKLMKMLAEESRQCDYLFFDTINAEPELGGGDSDWRARPALFKLRARSLGLTAYRLRFNYRCPRVSLQQSTCERPFSLLCVPLNGKTLPRTLPKSLILEFLKFIYTDCYGDFYATDDPLFEQHQSYLKDIIARYELELQDEIPVD